jgi:hypothetical protein
MADFWDKLDKWTRGPNATGPAGRPKVPGFIERAATGQGQKYSNDPNSRRGEAPKEPTAEERRTKAMGARFPTGKEADKRMQAAAKRRSADQAIYAQRKASKATGGKGASPFDSSEDQKKYNSVRDSASKESPYRPTGTRTQQRDWRAKNGDYKGKYYGPDQFKGNMAMIKAWKKAGKPDRNSFAKSYKG